VTGTTGTFTTVTGALQTASQTNITAVGTLGALAVTGNVATGNVSGTTGTFGNIRGKLLDPNQNNITTVGNLTALEVSNDSYFGANV
jgi:Na+/H+ antiporter NhaC